MTDTTQHRARDLFGSGELPAGTRGRILHVALELFYVRGFHAVGLDQIIAGAGVTKTTFYNHFASKDDLIVAALELRDQWETASFQQRIKELAGDDPRKQLLAMFDVLDEYFTHPDYRGCMFLNACSEYPSPHDPIHQAAAAHYHRSEQSIAQIARQAGARQPDAFAQQWTTLMQGVIARRYITHDDLSAKNVRQAARVLLEKHAKPARPRRPRAKSQ
ncbi:MAG: TetR/AcrR family transcriptional regulator [Phycisphaeraceae bacterium]|nr:TetR/AcrR family transcriptional regulator [Phycisphaeraceae bacterium]